MLLAAFASSGRSQTETKLTAGADADHQDRFGSAVAVDGDRMVVGAPLDDEAATDAGAVYIFQRENGVWIEEAKLVADDAEESDEFGSAVDLEGDFLVVGARFDDDSGQNSGAAYAFQRIDSTWNQQKLTGFDSGNSDFFGSSVTIDAAIPPSSPSDDIVYTIAVGSPAESDTGVVYVFELGVDGVTWASTFKLVADDGFVGDNFGAAVALGGEFLAIGAPEDDDAGPASGAVYSFRRGNFTGAFFIWAADTKAVPAELGTSDFFGQALAAEQTTGTAATRVVVGVRRDDDRANDAGAAYVLGLDAVSWFLEQKLTASDAAASDFLGRSVAVSGRSIVVGADGVANDAGALYVYRLHDGTWNESPRLSASDGTPSDVFGFAAAVGPGVAIAGARSAPVPGSGDAGAVYVYEDFPIFSDGFESGNTSAWSTVVP